MRAAFPECGMADKSRRNDMVPRLACCRLNVTGLYGRHSAVLKMRNQGLEVLYRLAVRLIEHYGFGEGEYRFIALRAALPLLGLDCGRKGLRSLFVRCSTTCS